MLLGSCETSYPTGYDLAIPTLRVPRKVPNGCNEAMSTKKIRRENVIALIDKRYAGNKAAFARAIDRPAPNIHRMLVMPSDELKDRRGIGEDLARDIEKRLGFAPGVLDIPGQFSDRADAMRASFANAKPVRPFGHTIPLISWVSAGLFCEAIDLFEPGVAEDWLPCSKKYGPHAYALRIEGDSMVSPYAGQRSYPPGYIVFVDPDRQVENGSRVIAKIPGSNEATFKVYAEDAGKRFLRPLNPAYPTIEMTEEMILCGVVVGGTWEE